MTSEDIKHQFIIIISVAQSRHAFVVGYSEHVGKMTDTRKQEAEKASEMPIKHSLLAGNVQIG